jgi:SAM-dependent methyltransferase
MIDQARALVAERKLANVGWLVGDACPLPFPDASFSVVSCRFAFHHFLEPRRVLAEMARVCRPGGRIVVTDLAASSDPAKAAALNRMEKLRDPSHVRALPLAELETLFTTSGLPTPRVASYGLESDVEGLLSRSFPDPGDVAELRRMFADSIADDALGLGVRRHGERIRFAYPVAILTATRA